jgi:hypothetical protein
MIWVDINRLQFFRECQTLVCLSSVFLTSTMARRKRRAGSMSSVADDGGIESTSSPAPIQPKNKKAKFEKRYNAEETSDADVLGEYCSVIQQRRTNEFESQLSRWKLGPHLYMSISKLLRQSNGTRVKYGTFLSVRSMSVLLLFASIRLISITIY